LLRALGLSPLQIEITFLHAATHHSKNTPRAHLDAFYKSYDDVRNEKFDAMIVTGAPVGHLDYEDVSYWSELTGIFAWARSHVFSTLFICWGALAGLYYYNGINKHILPRKKSGIYRHRVSNPRASLVAGFDDFFDVPVSRHTEIRKNDVTAQGQLEILAECDDAGVFILQEKNVRRVYILNHLEYDAGTIGNEYVRDMAAGMDPDIPHNYFPDNNPAAAPQITWRAHRTLLFNNWINRVYQDTPYDLADLKPAD
jgi:homoserine O-succinyltransferase